MNTCSFKAYVKQKNEKIELLDGLFEKNETEQVWMSICKPFSKNLSGTSWPSRAIP